MKLLIISYYFPPYPKVGSRRWAKHFKYLRQSGVEAYVLCKRFEGKSSWDKDVSNLLQYLTQIDVQAPTVPYFQKQLPKNLADKIKWKLSYWTFSFTKKFKLGNYCDVSIGASENFYKAARQLILQYKINTVLISCGPFSYAKIIPQLKTDFPNLKFVMDYRDYWEDGFSILSEGQRKYELEMQENVLKAVDLVLSPNDEMQSFYKRFVGKSYKLPHAVDIEDFNFNRPKVESKVLKFVYGGAFYHDISEDLLLIKSFMHETKLYSEVEAEFYVSVRGYENEIDDHLIKRYDFIDSIDYFQKVSDSTAVFLILPPDRANAMSSKFFELVTLKKPILYFGAVGEVSRFIEQHRLGFHIKSENLKHCVNLVLKNVIENTIPMPYDIAQHTFAFQTQLLIQELESLN